MSVYIAIDFDGTIAKHEYPRIGNEVPNAFYWMKRFEEAGAKLILNTMRSDEMREGNGLLTEAVEFCKERGIEFYGINENPDQCCWTNSRKVWAQVYIDDHGVCVPLIYPATRRPYVDWSIVGPLTMETIRRY